MNRPALVGILNVTPDSFSGGTLGAEAVARAKQLVQDGADILDLGAESTRPGATPLSAVDEWARLEPVLSAVMGAPCRLSIDTRHVLTAARALEFGVHIINDVGGLRDEQMRELLSGHECDVVVMHALSIPANPQVTLPPEADPIQEIMVWKNHVTTQAEQAGITRERLIYDPGIGFGKTVEQSLALIERAGELVKSGGRWLYGHSRKSFMQVPMAERDERTLELSITLAVAGVTYLRVHDVARHNTYFDRVCM